MEKKLPSISLETLVFLYCGSRPKCFIIPLTNCFSSVPPSSNLLFCLVSLNLSVPPFPVEIFYFWSLFNSFTPMSDKTEFLLTKSIQYQTDKWWEQRKIYFRGVLVDWLPNSQSKHHKNSMADSKEKYSCEFGSERVNAIVSMLPNIHSDIPINQLKMTEVRSKLREKPFYR